jgi:hypothetical protein
LSIYCWRLQSINGLATDPMVHANLFETFKIHIKKDSSLEVLCFSVISLRNVNSQVFLYVVILGNLIRVDTVYANK